MALVDKPLKQKGSALLMALFITAVCAILTFAMLDRQSMDIQRISLTLTANQAYLYTQGASIWAKHYLQGDIYKPAGNNQRPWFNWPVVMPAQRLSDGGVVTAILMDAQSFYNINNLQDENQQTSFIQFLKNTLPSAYAQNAQSLVAAIIEWISPVGQNTNVSLEEYYMNHQPPYRAAHHFMLSISELRLINGISQQVYNLISPYLIALPENVPLNINTTSLPILMTINNTITLAQAQELINLRNSHGGFEKLQDFIATPLVQSLKLQQTNLTTTSNYFLLRVDVNLKTVHMTLFSLLQRKVDQNNKPTVIMLWQTIGTL